MLGVAALAPVRARAPAASSTRGSISRSATAGFVIVLVASCALAALHWSRGRLPQGAGGIVGSAAGDALASGLDLLGATLLLLAAWMAGAAVAFGVSWFTRHGPARRLDLVAARAGCASAGSPTPRGQRRARGQARAQGGGAGRAEAGSRAADRRRASRRRRRRRPRASGSRRSGRCRCSIRRRRRSCRRWICWMIRATREPSYSPEALEAMSRLVELKLKDFGVEVEVVAVHPGPVVTRFEMRAGAGRQGAARSPRCRRTWRARSSTISVRVVEVIPGKSVMGLEIPNEKREIVTLGEIIKSKAYEDVASPLTLALGKDIGGVPMVADLARMPHLLIAGTTGSGKSVGDQRDGAEPAVQGHGRARAPDHDRPEDAGAVGLRGHSAPAGAGRHRHEAGGERAALVRRRDGAALPADGGARACATSPATTARVKDAIDDGQADPRSGDAAARRQRSEHRSERRSRTSSRCRSSW